MTFFQGFEFKKTFIDIDFDEILSSNNNPLVNSSELYLIYKQNYINDTINNNDIYNELDSKIKSLESQSQNNNNKITFVYIDSNELQALKYKRKMLYISQQKKLQNFLHYIKQLNSDYDKYVSNIKDDTSSIKSNKSNKFKFKFPKFKK